MPHTSPHQHLAGTCVRKTLDFVCRSLWAPAGKASSRRLAGETGYLWTALGPGAPPRHVVQRANESTSRFFHLSLVSPSFTRRTWVSSTRLHPRMLASSLDPSRKTTYDYSRLPLSPSTVRRCRTSRDIFKRYYETIYLNGIMKSAPVSLKNSQGVVA